MVDGAGALPRALAEISRLRIRVMHRDEPQRALPGFREAVVHRLDARRVAP